MLANALLVKNDGGVIGGVIGRDGGFKLNGCGGAANGAYATGTYCEVNIDGGVTGNVSTGTTEHMIAGIMMGCDCGAANWGDGIKLARLPKLGTCGSCVDVWIGGICKVWLIELALLLLLLAFGTLMVAAVVVLVFVLLALCSSNICC